MNSRKAKGIFISILILFAVGLIWNFKGIDYQNVYKENGFIYISEGDGIGQLAINKDRDMYLDTVQFCEANRDNDEKMQITLNLTDKLGYLLYTQTINIENGVDCILHPQCKIAENDEYLIEIMTSDADSVEIMTTYYEYGKLSWYIRISILFVAAIMLGLTYLVCTDNGCYNKIKDGVLGLLNKNTPPSFWEYFVWILLFLIPFVTLMYGDTRAFVHYEVNFWKSIKEGGGLRYFYEYSNRMLDFYRSNHISGAFEVIYDFPVYIILGIWGLPLWLICTAFNLEETSHVWTMIYGKSIYLVFLPIVAYLIYKVCKNIGVSTRNSKWASYLFLSSIVVFVDIGIMGQLDILGMPFTLLGIFYFQKKCKWKFILFFAVAVSFKQFPLFVFIPLLLLIEKRVVKIVWNMALAVGLTFLTNLPFPRGTVAMQVKEQIRDKFIESFLGAKLPIYNGIVPVIVLLIGAVCVGCYLKDIKNQEELEQFSIFIPLLVMFILFTSFDSNPYWFIHLAPFLAIMLVYNAKHYNRLILFETIGMLCLILNQFATNFWCFDTDAGEGMLLDVMFGRPHSYITIEKLLPYFRLDIYSPVCFAGYMLAISTIIWLSRPGHIGQADIPVRWQALLRMVLNAGVAMIPTLLYVASVIVFG
ncbi:MAG: hypothetical protein K2P63_08195 [Lachnospiraceae bacterium]|nr:hypothetical protein [Lachnospiraceae bacterium]